MSGDFGALLAHLQATAGGDVPRGTPTPVGSPSPAQINADLSAEAAGQNPQAAQLRLLRNEQATSPQPDPALDRMVARVQGSPGVPGTPQSAPAAATVSAPQGSGSIAFGPLLAHLQGVEAGRTQETPVASSGTSETAKSPTAAETPELAGLHISQAPGQLFWNVATGVGSTIVGGWKGLATLASGGSLSDAADAVRNEQERGTYQPPAGTAGAMLAKTAASPYNPVNWWTEGAHWLGGKAQEGATALGASPEVAGVAGAATETGANAAALLLPEMLRRFKAGIAEVKGGPPSAPPGGGQPISEAQWTGANAPEAPKAASGLGETVELATGRPEPVAPGLTLPEGPAFTTQADIAPKGMQLPEGQQAARAATLSRVGLDSAHEGAVSGDAKAAATFYQGSKLTGKAGDVMKSQLDRERAALTEHADNIVRNTGGTAGTDAEALYTRGDAILKPLAQLKSYFDQKIRGLYAEADARAQGQPTNLNGFKQTLGDDSLLTNSDRVQLRSAVGAYLRKLGMIGDDGQISGTAKQAETLRKYLGENWSPQANGMIRDLKNALDADVTSSAGQDIYAQARAVHAMKKAIFENDVTDAQGREIPNGVGKLVDAAGRKLELLKPTEKIADTVAALPRDEFAQVVATLQNVPPEIQPEAQAALSEIKAQFANKIRETGGGNQVQWNAKNVSGYLNKNAAKIKILFSPEEMANIRDLNDAGHILHFDSSYPGAAVQEHNLLRSGMMGAARAGGAAIGGVFGPLGAAAGDIAGASAASKAAERFAASAAQKRIVPLSEIVRGKGAGSP